MRVEIKEKIVLAIFLIVIFLFSIRLIEYRNQIYLVHDEVGYWGIAAKYAGYSWDGLFENLLYYSYGYSFLLFPFFLFNLDSETMYHCAVILNALLICGSFLLVVSCLKVWFEKSSKINRIFLSGILSFFPYLAMNANYGWPECLLYFLFWLNAFLIINLSKNFNIQSLLWVIMCNLYIYTVHQRAIGINIASFLTLLVVFFLKNVKIKKKEYFKIVILTIVFFTMLILIVKIKEYNIETLFTSKELVSINDFSGQKSKLFSILSINGVINLTRSFLGKIYYLGVSTFGIGIIGLILLVRDTLIYLLEWKKYYKKEIVKLIFTFYVCLSILGMMAVTSIGLIVDWSKDAIKIRPDMIFYGRYYEFVIIAVMIYGLKGILKIKDNKKVFVFTSILFLLSSLVVQVGVDSIDIANTVEFNTTGLNLFYFYEDKLDQVFLSIALIIIIFLILTYFLLIKSKNIYRSIKIILFIILLIWLKEIKTDDLLIKSREQYNEEFVFPTVNYLENKISKNEIFFVKDKNEKSLDLRAIYYLQYNLYKNEIKYLEFDELGFKKNKLKKNSIYIVLHDSVFKEQFMEETKLIYNNKKIYLFQIS